MYLNFHEYKDPKIRAIEHLLPKPLDDEQHVDKEDLDIAGLDFDDARPPAPETPLGDPAHFHPDDQLVQDLEEEEEPLPRFADEVHDTALDHVFPEFDDDEPMDELDSNVMLHAFLSAGTDLEAAKLYVNKIYNGKATFVEMYGQGSIVAEANKNRRSLNITGLNAFDLRTLKPDGQPWNFNVRADRKLARQMINEADPEWIIGSPPCTAFCIWNRQPNYRKMPIEKVRQAISEGERHLRFCCSLYRRQLMHGKHFLHEHPARALSWNHPQVLSISRMAGVHLVTADQCMYGLTTPNADGDGHLPAMKSTKFLTSSIHMARQLQTRCDRSHVHQQLVGGRCKEAAYYPLELIRAILQGIKDTSAAAKLGKEEEEEFSKTLMAISQSSSTCPVPASKKDEVRESRVPKTGGGYLSIKYDHWKPRYTDEYTGELLPDGLVQDAMIDELNYFNDHVWQVQTIDQMKQVPTTYWFAPVGLWPTRETHLSLMYELAW